MMEAGDGESWEEQKLLSPIHLGSNPSWLSAQKKYVQMSFDRKFTAALFIMTLTWKQPKYPSTVEWIQPRYIHTMDYSIAE